MQKNDIAYYRKRLDQERLLETSAETEVVRGVHRKLAGMYAERLVSMGAGGEPVVGFNRIAS